MVQSTRSGSLFGSQSKHMSHSLLPSPPQYSYSSTATKTLRIHTTALNRTNLTNSTLQTTRAMGEGTLNPITSTLVHPRWSLRGMTALVTGGTRGIGFLLSLSLSLSFFAYMCIELDGCRLRTLI